MKGLRKVGPDLTKEFVGQLSEVEFSLQTRKRRERRAPRAD